MSFDPEFARRARESVRPKECRSSADCWVEDGTLATLTRNSMIHCKACGGYIGHPPHSPWRHRPKEPHGRAEP